MSRSATTQSGWQKHANRSWALAVLKTAYRDTYPSGSGESITDNAREVEGKMFAKSNSKSTYDTAVSKAADAIRTFGATARKDGKSIAEAQMSTAGRTPKAMTSLQSAPNLESTSQITRPSHDAVTRLKKAGRKSLTPVKASKVSGNGAVLSANKNLSGTDVRTELGRPNFFGINVDPSDVIKLTPFILEAGVQVIGKIENGEQARNITESEKSSIGFLGIEKMYRALERAARNAPRDGSQVTSSKSSFKPLKQPDRREILDRVGTVRGKYLEDIKTIYALLSEDFGFPDCDEWMIVNIGKCLRKLDELENPRLKVSKETGHTLEFVENVFKSVIEQYGKLLDGGNGSSHAVNATGRDNARNGAGPSQAGNFAVLSNEWNGSRHWPSRRGPRGRRDIGGGGDGSDDNEYFNRRRGSHYNERPVQATLFELKAKYSANITALVPLVEAAIANHEDRTDILETSAYVRAFLDLDREPDEGILRSAERTISEFYERWRYLLQQRRVEPIREAGREPCVQYIQRPLSLKAARKTAPIPRAFRPPVRSARMTASGPSYDSVSVEEEEDYDDDEEEKEPADLEEEPRPYVVRSVVGASRRSRERSRERSRRGRVLVSGESSSSSFVNEVRREVQERTLDSIAKGVDQVYEPENDEVQVKEEEEEEEEEEDYQAYDEDDDDEEEEDDDTDVETDDEEDEEPEDEQEEELEEEPEEGHGEEPKEEPEEEPEEEPKEEPEEEPTIFLKKEEEMEVKAEPELEEEPPSVSTNSRNAARTPRRSQRTPRASRPPNRSMRTPSRATRTPSRTQTTPGRVLRPRNNPA